jgi:hypothetical protein
MICLLRICYVDGDGNDELLEASFSVRSVWYQRKVDNSSQNLLFP